MKKTNVLGVLILGAFLLCTGCTNKIINELLYIVTDGVYTMDVAEEEEGYVPSISFDTSEKTFEFSYDPLSSYLNYGTYVIEDNEVILTTDDEKYTYTFKILDDTILSFIAEKSDSTITVEGVTAVPDEAVFSIKM